MNMKQLSFRIWATVMLFLFMAIQAGYCRENPDNNPFARFTDTFDGSLSNTTALRLHELDRFVKIENRFTLRYDRELNRLVRVIFAGDAVYDAFYDVEDDVTREDSRNYAPFETVSLRPEDDRNYHTYMRLQEALLEISLSDSFDIGIGKQKKIGWGKVKGARMLNCVKPRNLRQPGLGDLPLWMAKVEYDLSPESYLQFLVLPKMEFIEMPPSGSEYDIVPLILKTLPASILSFIPSGWQLVIEPVEEPEMRLENTAFGIKFDSVNMLKGLDVTVNYLYTWDDEPVFNLRASSMNLTEKSLTLFRTPERLHVLGGTLIKNIWKGTLRGEVAAKFGKRFYDPSDFPDIAVEKTLLSYALEFERKLFDISWLFQALQDRVLDYDDTIVYPMSDAVSTTLTLGGGRQFRDNTWGIGCFVAYRAGSGDFFIRPAAQYAFNDSVKVTVGADLFEGQDDDSYIGYLDGKDRFYISLKYSF
jgi:hypothetical protein